MIIQLFIISILLIAITSIGINSYNNLTTVQHTDYLTNNNYFLITMLCVSLLTFIITSLLLYNGGGSSSGEISVPVKFIFYSIINILYLSSTIVALEVCKIYSGTSSNNYIFLAINIGISTLAIPGIATYYYTVQTRSNKINNDKIKNDKINNDKAALIEEIKLKNKEKIMKSNCGNYICPSFHKCYKNTKGELKCADPKSSSICGDVVCTGTEKCTDGKCKPPVPPVPPKKKNKCGNTFCTGNQTCYNNICMDLPDIDTNLFTQS